MPEAGLGMKEGGMKTGRPVSWPSQGLGWWWSPGKAVGMAHEENELYESSWAWAAIGTLRKARGGGLVSGDSILLPLFLNGGACISLIHWDATYDFYWKKKSFLFEKFKNSVIESLKSGIARLFYKLEGKGGGAGMGPWMMSPLVRNKQEEQDYSRNSIRGIIPKSNLEQGRIKQILYFK